MQLKSWWIGAFGAPDPVEVREWREQEEEEAFFQNLNKIGARFNCSYLTVQEVFNILGNLHDMEHCFIAATERAIGPIWLAKQVKAKDDKRIIETIKMYQTRFLT